MGSQCSKMRTANAWSPVRAAAQIMPAPVHAAVEDTDVPKSAQITPEEKVAQPCTSFGALNFLLHDQCVALIKASFVRTCRGPIDLRQNVPPEHTFYDPLVLGSERHSESGALMPEDVPIALSYSWGPNGRSSTTPETRTAPRITLIPSDSIFRRCSL